MRRYLLSSLALIAIMVGLLTSSAAAKPVHHARVAVNPFIAVTVGQSVVVRVHNLTPGTYIGAVLAYRPDDNSAMRTSRINIVNSTIQTGDYNYEVDENGDARIGFGKLLISHGALPGRLVIVVSTTDGFVLDAEPDLT